MTRLLISSLVLAAFSAGANADPDIRSPTDLFGQPRVHGPTVEKAFLGIYSGRTDLYFGQPITVELFAIPATTEGPFIHARLVRKTTKITSVCRARSEWRNSIRWSSQSHV